MSRVSAAHGRKYVVKSGRELRLGYTTGSCAAAAAVAAARTLLRGETVEVARITLPSGERAVLDVETLERSLERVTCAVVKDAGDDPDVTHGMTITASCERIPEGITILGGVGVGMVSSGGLPVPPGEAAINPGPRAMITENARAVCAEAGYGGGLRITIAAPGGQEIATRTFNPRLGITGGISILGTTGIVEPMSEKAVVETIKLLLDKRALQDPENLLLTPGNYGLAFCRAQLGLDMEKAVKYGNFLGESLDYAVYKGFRRLLLVGHAGKLLKAAGGIMDTHSRVADCRMEIIAAHAACAGAGPETARAIMAAATTDEALDAVRAYGIAEPCFAALLERLLAHIRHRVRDAMDVGVVVFSRDMVVMQSGNAASLADAFKGERA